MLKEYFASWYVVLFVIVWLVDIWKNVFKFVNENKTPTPFFMLIKYLLHL